MGKLPEVEEAKALMTEAAGWSVMKWLREKKRVRKVADKANAALDELDRKVKAGWSWEVASVYKDIGPIAGTKSPGNRSTDGRSQTTNSKVKEFVQQVKQ